MVALKLAIAGSHYSKFIQKATINYTPPKMDNIWTALDWKTKLNDTSSKMAVNFVSFVEHDSITTSLNYRSNSSQYIEK